MKKVFVFLFLFSLSFSALSQKIVVEGQIIDSVTKEPLPYANIYAGNSGTISNQEGFFYIKLLSVDTELTVSYVGYEKKKYQAGYIPSTIELTPLTFNLEEVIITPVDCRKIVDNLFHKYKSIVLDKNLPIHQFFYRQTTKTDTVCHEILEAFFDATSVLCIQDLKLNEGRYAVLGSDSLNQYLTFTNFFQYSQITPIDPKDDRQDKIVIPLRVDYGEYYDLSVDILNSGNDFIYKLNFSPKNSIKRAIIKGSLFIEPKQLTLLKFEGEAKNNPPGRKKGDSFIERHKLAFSVIYKELNGLSVVESVNINNSFVLAASNESHVVEINSILYNTGTEGRGKGKKVNLKTNLLELIAKRKYSPEFWRENSIIKRTPLEENAIRIFERSNLFGTYTK